MTDKAWDPHPAADQAFALRGAFPSLGKALDAAADQFGERDAYVERDRVLSFRDWRDGAASLAACWKDMGVGPGDVVAIMLPQSIDYAVCCAAGVRIGAVVTGINGRLGKMEIDAIIDQAEPKLLITDDDHSPDVGGIAIMRRSDVRRLAKQGRSCPVADVAPDAAALIVWTSGTTGIPKGAWFDHDGLLAAARVAPPLAAAHDRRLMGTPFAHIGYMGKLWEQAAFGITIVIAPHPWRVDDMIDAIETKGVNAIAAVPTQWEKLVASVGTRTGAGRDMRICVSVAAPATAELVRAIRATLHAPMIVRYAMTECTSIAGTQPNDPPELAEGTVGRPLPGIEVRLCDERDVPVDTGTIGRLQVRAACMMRGYWRAADETARAFAPGGWLRTGDMAHWDDNGCLVLSGRAGDMYIRGGYNVYPGEVEACLATHPAIAAVCVVGVAAPVIGEIGVACVVPADWGAPPDLVDLRSWCASAIADYKAPDRMILIDDIPLTPMMKVNRKRLRALAQGEIQPSN